MVRRQRFLAGVYAPDDFDLAGFAVGIVDEDKFQIQEHSNPAMWFLGFHLRVFTPMVYPSPERHFSTGGYNVDTKLEEFEEPLGRVMLLTQLYVRDVMAFLTHSKFTAAAHITGGGLLGQRETRSTASESLSTNYFERLIFNVV